MSEEKRVKFCTLVRDAISDEKDDIGEYETLIKLAEEFGKRGVSEHIQEIQKDEREHKKILEAIHEFNCKEEPLKEAPLKEALDKLLGLEEDPTSAKCELSLKEGPTCGNFRDVRRFVLCHGWAEIDKGVDYREAIHRGWVEAKKRCTEL